MGATVLFGAPVRFWLCVLVVSLCAKAKADVEYALDLTARSYALSGTLTGSLAYGLLLWGNPTRAPWYGYLKPEVQLGTSGSYNSGLAQIKFFPISFVGVAAGVEGVSNVKDYADYDCVIYRCLGRSWRRFGEIHLAVKKSGLFAFVKGGLSDWRQEPDQDRDFINPTWGLATLQQGDRLRFLRSAVGFEVSKSWTLVYADFRAEMRELKGKSQMHLGLAQWRGGNWKMGIGGGVFKSELKDSGATAVLNIEYRGSGPGLDLF